MLFRLSGDATWGALAFPAIMLLGSFWSLCLPKKWKNPGVESTPVPPPAVRERIRTTGRALAVVPLVIAGLGLTRPYARPLLLGPQIGANDDLHVFRQVEMWFAFGVVAVACVGPAVIGLIRRGQDRWLDHPDVPEQAPSPLWHDRRRWVPTAVGVVLLLAAVVMGILLALEPPRLRTLGVLVLFLATVALIAGGFARYAEYHLPLPVLRYLHFQLTPLWLLVAGALVLEAKLDTTGGYHEVRLKPRQALASAPAHPSTLRRTSTDGSRQRIAAWTATRN
ncbi:hypothetical protein [Streptomyces sp. NPDC007905]|uniref:hypothetical protein n=1 Tax=Streptomyces sp. NPDC007905 TaxID=3364788 RepID=UPI0036E0175C